MRGLFGILLVLSLGVGAFFYFRSGGDSSNADSSSADDSGGKNTTKTQSGAEAQRSGPGAESPANDGGAARQGLRLAAEQGSADTEIDLAAEETRLRKSLQEHPGPEGDADRVRLAEILLKARDRGKKRQAEELLSAVWKRGGESAPAAALLLVRGADDPQIRLASASYLSARGRGTPGYLESLVTLAHGQLANKSESARITAWQQLSEAYFGRQDPAWRDALRPDLDLLVKELIFSPELTGATATYKIKSGDTLVRIAKEFGTTVDSLRWLNALKGDVIHPGKTLKVMTGTVAIEVSKSNYRLDARLDGKYLFSARVGLGKHGKTPVGEFSIDLKQENPAWQKPGQKSIPYGSPDNPLGDRWLGFKDTEELSGYGIHGTKDPNTIGTDSSEGCVRLLNEDVVLLFRLAPLGTKVTILE